LIARGALPRCKKELAVRAVTRGLGVLLCLCLPPSTTTAQPSRPVPTIGLLTGLTCAEDARQSDPLRQALRDRGYEPGRSARIECRSSAGQAGRMPELARELVRLNVDVLVTQGTVAALAAQQATTSIAIVITLVADAVGSGLVNSLARPGANITGLSIFGPQIVPKQLDLLKEVAPWIKRVAVLVDLSNPGLVAELSLQDVIARELRLDIQRVDVRGPADLDTALAAVVAGRADAILMTALPLRPEDARRIMQFAQKNRLPTIGTVSQMYVETGVLLFYTFSLQEHYQRMAHSVDRILKGARPADLPVEQPTRFEVVLNVGTAKALDIKVPDSLMLRVDRVIDERSVAGN
jgi:putative ABC transport system substrate-binding protein